MKWKHINKDPEEVAMRIRHKFLLFPKCINNKWRWLEKAAWKEKYIWHTNSIGGSKWVPVMWIDNMNIYHKDNIVNEAMTNIELTLEKEYGLNTKDAIKAIKDSGVIKVYSSDIELSSHEPIELWVEVVYKHYLIFGGKL